MKRFSVFVGIMLLSVAVNAQQRGMSPEQKEALLKQEALEKASPRLQITEEVLRLDVPGHTIGETEGVAKNSKGHLFVYTRAGAKGNARGATAAQLFEFDPNLKFVKEWVPDNYAASFAHGVRVDRHDNVWYVDEGSNMILKINPQGQVEMTLGRKPEAIDYYERYIERGEKDTGDPPQRMGVFNRQTDVAFDAQDNIFVADGYNNARVVKIAKDGTWVKALGEHGAGPNQFNTVHTIATDAKGNVYVGDRGNRRIQVFDNNLTPLRIISTVAAPWGICITPGPTQYIYSGDGNGKLYKTDLEGNLLGWAQTKQGHGQTGCLIHSIHCESETVLYSGDCSAWLVEKITIKGITKP